MIKDIIFPDFEIALKLRHRILKESGETDIDDSFISEDNFHYVIETIQDVGNEEKSYGTAIVKKSAYALYSLVQNHPFWDGNKRTAFAISMFILKANGFRLTAAKEQSIEFVLNIAKGNLKLKDVEEWILNNVHEL
ncbi:MAG: type II toxin-antitoxin system death-on-curing family toxin [Nitrososphaerales archaeon]